MPTHCDDIAYRVHDVASKPLSFKTHPAQTHQLVCDATAMRSSSKPRDTLVGCASVLLFVVTTLSAFPPHVAADVVYYSGKATHYGPYVSDSSQDESGFKANGDGVGCTAVDDPNGVWDYIVSQGTYSDPNRSKLTWPKIPLFAVSENYYSYDYCWEKIVVRSTSRNVILEGFIVDVCGEGCDWKESVESGYLDVYGEYTWRLLGGTNDNGIIDIEIQFPNGMVPSSKISQAFSYTEDSVDSAYVANSPAIAKLSEKVTVDAQLADSDAFENMETAIDSDMISFNEDMTGIEIDDNILKVQILLSDTVEAAVSSGDESNVETTSNEVSSEMEEDSDGSSSNSDDDTTTDEDSNTTSTEDTADTTSTKDATTTSSKDSDDTTTEANDSTSTIVASKTSTVISKVPETIVADESVGKSSTASKMVFMLHCKGENCDSTPGWLIAVVVIVSLLATAFAALALYSYKKKKWLFSASVVGAAAVRRTTTLHHSRSTSPRRPTIQHDPFSEFKK